MKIKLTKLLTVLSFQLLFTFLGAQYTEEWSVDQDQNEWGFLYFDANEDGVPELTKFWWNTVALYDGANDYQLIWYIYDEEYDYLAMHEAIDLNDDGIKEAIFISNNVFDDISSKITIYHMLNNDPIWISSDYSGSISWIDAADTDSDSVMELIFGINQYNSIDSTYSSSIYVLDGMTGVEEWVSDTYSGYINGPYVGDMDGDGTPEILVNFYDFKNEVYQIRVLSHSGVVGVELNPKMPEQFSIGSNFPNPFNSSTVIPVMITEKCDIDITILDMKGRLIARLLNGTLASGKYQFS